MVAILLSVIVGVVGGIFLKIDLLTENADMLSTIGLCLLLFFIGIDIGSTEDMGEKLKKMNKKVLLLPFVAIFGSLVGGAVSSFVLALDMKECIAIASGMGWYSFSAIELGRIQPYLGGVALMTNVFREVFSLIFVPIVAKKIGSYESVAICGATSMDTLLPVINQSNPPRISIVAFYSGFVISSAVPILLPIIITVLGIK